MKDRLEVIAERYNQISEMLLDINVVSDIKKLTALSKEQKSLEKIVIKYKELQTLENNIESTQKQYNNGVKSYDNLVASQDSAVAGVKDNIKLSELTSNTDMEQKQVDMYEEQLDKIGAGELAWVDTISGFYDDFDNLTNAAVRKALLMNKAEIIVSLINALSPELVALFNHSVELLFHTFLADVSHNALIN